MKRASLNLILALVLIALGVAVYFSQKKAPPPKPPLTTLNSAAIRTVTLDVPKHKAIKLEKSKSGQWVLTQPVQARADPEEVNGLLNVATLPCKEKIALSEVKLANLGLAPPRYTLQFDKTRIDAGEIEPLKYSRYVKTGDRICLIRNPSAPALNGDYSSLVSKQLLPTGSTITGIDLPKLKISRSADGKAWAVDPADPKAAKDAAQKLADAWAGARSGWNKPVTAADKTPALAEYATLHFKNGRMLKFLIAERAPQLVLERADIGVRYALSKQDVSTLLSLQKAPVEKKAAAAPASAKSTAAASVPTKK